jgi:hypothetical protein
LSVSWFDCDESLTWRGLNSNLRYFGSFTFILVSCGESCCFSRGMHVAGAAWRAATRIVVRVGDLVQRIGDGRTGRVLDGRVIEKSDDTVCGLHHARGDEKRGFLD